MSDTQSAARPAGPPGGRGPPGPAIEVDEQRVHDFASLFRLDGKRVILVGGYGGIGEVTSRLFADYGAEVAIAGRSEEKAKTLAEELSGDGHRAVGLRVDLADRDSARELVSGCVAQLGGIDVLVNLAGIDLDAPAAEFDPDEWRSVIDVNLSGAFWLSQAAGEAMIDAGRGGRIIHYSTTRSVAGGAQRGFAAYAASKAGLNGLIRQLATEWGKHRITVNGIAPGFVPTELVQDAAGNEMFMTMMLRRIPFGRFGEPLELASATLFLASPAASFMTGQIIFVDGGVTASS
jgi:NAD(P)-dependent dehydrogenase (short-subunit alcohol dehydrogenase family)